MLARLSFASISCIAALLVAITSGAPLSAQDKKEVQHFSEEALERYKTEKPRTIVEHADVLVLQNDDTFSFDSDGRVVHTAYRVYKVLTQQAAEWDEVSVHWEPWHEERPTIRARVISADGVVHQLDSATITDSTGPLEHSHADSDDFP